MQRITENNLTPETPRSMYNALKVLDVLDILYKVLDVLGSSVSERFETKNEIHKMFFFLFLSVTLHTFVSIDRSNIFYLFTFL